MTQTSDLARIEQARRELMPGSVLEGHYTIVRELGRGGMGVVYLAEDTRLRRRAAVKVLIPRKGREQADLERFQKEAQALAQIRHPNVVQVFSLGQHEALEYFVMEHVEGETLAALLSMEQARGAFLPVDVVLGILTQMCDALAEVHRRGIVHHDVKPLNVMVTSEYHALLMDFGLARDPREGEHHFAGTIYYVAPEECARKPLPAERAYLSDIYSLGAVAYELLTGRPPFVGDNAMQILWQHLEAQPVPPSELRPELPASFDQVVLRALAKDPDGRPRTCRALKVELTEAREAAAWDGGERFGARPPTTSAPRPPLPLEAGPCVLIADADPAVRVALAGFVHDVWANARTVECSEGFAALKQATRLRPALVLTELDLPQMNGLELCAALRAQEGTADVPVVVMTGSGGERDRQLVRSLGARDVIDKPVRASAVRPLLESILGGRRVA